MPYSNDLRQKAMEMHFVHKQTIVAVSQLLNIGYDTSHVQKPYKKYRFYCIL